MPVSSVTVTSATVDSGGLSVGEALGVTVEGWGGGGGMGRVIVLREEEEVMGMEVGGMYSGPKLFLCVFVIMFNGTF